MKQPERAATPAPAGWGAAFQNTKPNLLNIDLQAADRFLRVLDRHAEGFTFQTFADTPEAKAEDKERERNGQPKRYARTFNGTFKEHALDLQRLNIEGAGVYVTINQTNLKGRKAENVTAVRSVFADTDGAPLEPIMCHPCKPQLIVESSPGKWHTYWLVDDLPLAQFEGVQRRIAEQFQTDACVLDLPRVLRLPGFYHRKAESFMVGLIYYDGNTPYSAEQIQAAFPPMPSEGTSRQARRLEIGEKDEILKALNHEGMVLSVRPDGAYNVTCPFADEHTTDSGQTETVYYPAYTGGFKSSTFHCMHAHCADRPRTDYTERLGLSGHLVPATYGELLAGAQALTADADPDLIERLITQSAALPSLQKRRVQEAIKKQTGTPFSVMAKVEQPGEQTKDLDHLELARALAQQIGMSNVLATQAHVWQWMQSGVWAKQEERSVKQWVQQYLSDNVEQVGKHLVDGVADLFKTEVFSPGHEFDIGPSECVNCMNGELVLTAIGWTLQPHNRGHYRTTQVPVYHEPCARAPRFIQFIREVFHGDPDVEDKAQALLEMIGYSLMAHCHHERFIILVGRGANGKSVLLAIIEALAGLVNVAGVQPSQFDKTFQRAHLHGKLVNIVTEVKQGEVIDDASLKGIVSGEPSTVEHKFRDPFVMRPFATCWFGTNHMPHTRDFSDALFRRALVVEFNNQFKPELGNCDPRLKEKLFAELPGILNLALDAYARALQTGFTMPESCRLARDRWRLEADQVAQFIEQECETVPGERPEPMVLFNAYRLWAGVNGIHKVLTQKSFVDRVVMLGFERKKSNGRRYLLGIKHTPAHYAFLNRDG